MPQVRIRSEALGTRSVPIGDVPLTREALDEAMDLVKAWGISIDGEFVNEDNLFGQFAIDGHAGYFEIVEGP